jgi:hypothetical protein
MYQQQQQHAVQALTTTSTKSPAGEGLAALSRQLAPKSINDSCWHACQQGKHSVCTRQHCLVISVI